MKANRVHEGRPTTSPLRAPGLQTTRIHSKSQGRAPRQGQEGPAPWKRRVGVPGQLTHLSLFRQSQTPKVAALNHIMDRATHSFLCRPRWVILPHLCWASLVAQRVTRLPAMLETWVQSLGPEDPLRREWQPTPALLPGESHGQRSLVGNTPWGLKELDTTEQLHFC